MNFATFFRYVQDTPWYDHFLEPVIDALRPLPPTATLLDIGTGAGKLIEAVRQTLGITVVGTDVDADMLAEARKRPSLAHTPLHLLEKGAPLPFPEASFDAVTFCSVLFLLDDPEPLLQEALRVLRPGGQIIVLTPTGNGRVQPKLLQQIGLNVHNWTFMLWRRMTSGAGRLWIEKGGLATFCQKYDLHYGQQIVFQGLAVVEIIKKHPR